MKAVVMAGGEGSRLRPITANRPKPLVPVGNLPIMAHILEVLRRNDITDVLVTLHYLADEVQGYFGDGSDFGVNLTYSIEDIPLGTAGSVKKAESFLQGEPFLIISGDALTDCDLKGAVEFHRLQAAEATIVLSRVSDPSEFGMVTLDDQDRVTALSEKPAWSHVSSDTVNTGIYVIEPRVLDLLAPGKRYDWSRDVFPMLLASGSKIVGFTADGYWCDVGTIEQYREAQQKLLSGLVQLEPQGAKVRDAVWIGSGTMVDETAQLIPPVCIGKNVKVKARAQVGPFSVIGDNCVVEEDATVERSVVWENAYIGASVSIRSAIVCSRVTIKKDCVVNEDAVVGDRCLLDAGAVIRPRIKLWPDKIIERGSTVTMSLVWGNKWRGNLFRELGVAGLSNIEITPDYATRLGSAFGSTLPPRSKVVTSRDSTRSSRMIKRAVIASLLSVGCDVLDLRSAPVPIARHFIKAAGAQGAVHVRKLPGNSRMTLIELFDASGSYLDREAERRVEGTFFREDYNRIDSEDLGVIEFASRAIEEYQSDFFRLIGTVSGRRLRVVCDYGYSSLAAIYPAMLSRLGVDSISLNGFNDAKLAPRNPEQIAKHVEHLRQVAAALEYDLGVLFMDEGERMIVIDDRGRTVSGFPLFGALGYLIAHNGQAEIAVSTVAPDALIALLEGAGAKIVRTRNDPRSLMVSASTMTGDASGGFNFSEFHPGFDAAFGFAQLVKMLRSQDERLSTVVDQLPDLDLIYDSVRCPWEKKGAVMRVIGDEWGDGVDRLDGVKRRFEGGWEMVLPDPFEPVMHLYGECEPSRLAGLKVHLDEIIQATA